MTPGFSEHLYRHDVERLTVGQLREALRDLPADMVLRAAVADAPGQDADRWGRDQFVIVAATVDSGDYLPADEFVIRVDYSSDWYVRPDSGLVT